MKDKICLQIEGGGIFSKMMLAIQNISAYQYGIENCYLEVVDERALSSEGSSPLSFILDQQSGKDFITKECKGFAPYSKLFRVENSPEYQDLKYIASKLRYKQELKVLVDDYLYMLGMNENTVGVHIRLCDMNTLHKDEYGYVGFEDYIKAIDQELDRNTKVFVASDNEESLVKLKRKYKSKVVFVPGLLRAKTEVEDSSLLQAKYFKEARFWQEAFLEMLLLSKCSKLICRSSNVANMAIISSNTIKKIITL
jgi:hypothetical protein